MDNAFVIVMVVIAVYIIGAAVMVMKRGEMRINNTFVIAMVVMAVYIIGAAVIVGIDAAIKNETVLKTFSDTDVVPLAVMWPFIVLVSPAIALMLIVGYLTKRAASTIRRVYLNMKWEKSLETKKFPLPKADDLLQNCWRPITEFDGTKYNWVVVRQADKFTPTVAERREDGKWYNQNGDQLPHMYDAVEFFDMELLNKFK